jgi:hypothetical protein
MSEVVMYSSTILDTIPPHSHGGDFALELINWIVLLEEFEWNLWKLKGNMICNPSCL